MKTRILFIALLLMAGTALQAQKVHTIREILDIMNDSDVSYSLSQGDFSESAYDYSELVLGNNVYRTGEFGSYEIHEYELTEEAEALLNEAENFFQQENYTSARSRYQKVLEQNPTCYNVMVYIGDTYFHEGNFQKASEWYKKAIKENYIDYLAHWAYANASYFRGDKETALREITVAKVLNRNNPRLTKKLQEIYKLNKLEYKDWYFTPKYAVEQTYDAKRDKDVVSISAEELWLPYALVQAVWEYEPNYAESMNNSLLLRHKEAVGAVAVTMEKNDMKKNLALKTLKKALDGGYYEAYVVYEDILTTNPRVCWQLDENAINSLVDYVLNVRCKVK